MINKVSQQRFISDFTKISGLVEKQIGISKKRTALMSKHKEIIDTLVAEAKKGNNPDCLVVDHLSTALKIDQLEQEDCKISTEIAGILSK